jgi:hypothetical protein
MIKKSMLIWLSFTPLAILNGGLRQYVLEPQLGETIAGILSVIILCLLIFIVSFIFIPKLGFGNKRTYLLIGIIWVFSTIIFETIFGIAMGLPITEIIQAYNIATGNLWLVVILFIGITPIIIAKMKRML